MKREEPPNLGKESRLTARQWEVLGQIAAGKPVTPVEGKRVDLTLNSLIRRGLIEPATQTDKGETIHYKLTITGLRLLESRSRAVEDLAEASFTVAEVEESRPPGTRSGPPARASRDESGTLPSVRVEKPHYIPKIGDIVWFLDQNGETDQVDHLVREVIPEQKLVVISPRWGDDFKKETITAHWSRVTPRVGG